MSMHNGEGNKISSEGTYYIRRGDVVLRDPSKTDRINTGVVRGQQRSGTHNFFDMRANHPLIALTAEGYDFYIAALAGLPVLLLPVFECPRGTTSHLRGNFISPRYFLRLILTIVVQMYKDRYVNHVVTIKHSK